MNRDQILAGCRIAHAEFEQRTGFKLSRNERMLYQAAFVAGALFGQQQAEAETITLSDDPKLVVDETKAVLRIVGRDTK